MTTTMGNGFVRYNSREEVNIGDVVILQEETNIPGYSPFATSLIEDIRPDEKYPDTLMVHLSRPHAKVSKIGNTSGGTYFTMEQYKVDMDSFLRRFLAYTTGHSARVDNRRM